MPLIDTGLLVRYYIDEAASGTAPTSILDYSGNDYHLTEVNYGSGNMAFTEDGSGNRGLDSTIKTGTQRARVSVSNTSDIIRDNVDGANKLTMEVVVQVTTGNSNGGRVFGLNTRDGANGSFILKFTQDADTVGELTVGNQNGVAPINAVGTDRVVLHLVYDSTLATAADRIKVYVDGSGSSIANGIGLNDNITLSTDSDLIMLNRESAGAFDRSFDGALYYAALYSGAFTAQNCADNYAILTANDDFPGISVSGTDGMKLGETLSYNVIPSPSICRIVSVL